MRVLVLGGHGLIGTPLVVRLLASGHSVVGIGRNIRAAARRLPEATWIAQDIAQLSMPEQWRPLLAGMEAVVNAAGVLQDSPRDDVTALQSVAMQAMFAACAATGVRRVVQISAATASREAPTAFLRSKAEADEALAALDLDWVILRPGVVFGPQAYGGTALLRGLAGFPMFIPLLSGTQPIRTVHVDDVVDAVMRSLEGSVPSCCIYDLVEPQPHTLGAIVLAIREWLGFAPARVVPMPRWLAAAAFTVGDWLGHLGWNPPMRTTALRQMDIGIHADPAAWTAVAGPLGGLRETLRRIPSTVQERWYARLWLLKPVGIGMLSLFWIATGIFSLVSWNESVSLLTDRGVSYGMAALAVIAGAGADLMLGAAILVRRWFKPVLLGMVAVSIAYLIIGTLVATDLWVDPLGPFFKVLLCLVIIAYVAAIAEER
jgi:nucleoside-diphosphate-sugar epimerase